MSRVRPLRGRLLASALAVVVVAVVTLAVPLAALGVHQVRDDFRTRLQSQANAVAVALGEQLEDSHTADPARLARLVPGRQVRAGYGSRTFVAGATISGGRSAASATAEHGARVTVVAAVHDEDERILAVLVVVALLVAGSAAVAIGLSLLLAGRLVRPLTALVGEADKLGRGEFELTPPRFGIPEADRIGVVLARSGRRIGELVDRQRQFARDAAHQLRTPLTAIGLRLEEIAGADVPPDVRDDAESALAQVDRLATVVTVLLSRAQGDASRPRPVDLVELFDELARHWGPITDREGRQLVVDIGPGPLVGLANRDHLMQALAVLAENAVRHGGGTIHLAAVRLGDDVRIDVTDDGPGVPSARVLTLFTRSGGSGGGREGDHGSGIGLFLARALIDADGGKIALLGSGPTTFSITLPAVTTVQPRRPRSNPKL
ncbi:MAG: sensor histidine kinase [Frankia sp.]